MGRPSFAAALVVLLAAAALVASAADAPGYGALRSAARPAGSLRKASVGRAGGPARLSAAPEPAAEEECPVSYSNITEPLLFGGRSNATCTRAGGSPCGRVGRCQWCRDWTSICRFEAAATQPLDCTAEQTAAAQLLANGAEDGAPMRLSPCDLYPYLRGRTLWLIGDSNTRSLFRAAQCFLLDLWEDQRVCAPSTDPNLVRQLDALPLKPGTPKCIHLAGGGRVCMVHVVQGWALANNTQVAGGGVLPLLYSNFSSPHDIVVVNFGNWHGPRSEPKSQEYVSAYKQALRLLGSFYLATMETRPHLIFQESASTHPYDLASQSCVDYSDPAAVGGGSFNKAAQEVLRDYSIPVVGNAAAFTAPAPWGHPGARAQGGRDGAEQGDCMHFCSPGVTELLLWTLWQAFNKGVAGIAPLPPGVGAAEWGCSEMRYY